ncbi:MAG: hypothetical protein WBP85_13365 [Terracidiphilus sp.]
MKRSILTSAFAVGFALVAFLSTAHAADTKDFPIKVHISSSELRPCGSVVNGAFSQCLGALIDGKKYELARINKAQRESFPVHPGDYQARLVKDEAKGAGEFEREYEILFPDGKTVNYQVVGEFE